MFVSLIIRFLAFQTPIAPAYKAKARSDDVKVVFTVMEMFSPRSFVGNDVGLLGRQYNDLGFGICRLAVSHGDPSRNEFHSVSFSR